MCESACEFVTPVIEGDDAPTGVCLHENVCLHMLFDSNVGRLHANSSPPRPPPPLAAAAGRRRWPPAAGVSGAKRKKGDTEDDVIPRGFCFCTTIFTKIYMWLFDLVVGRLRVDCVSFVGKRRKQNYTNKSTLLILNPRVCWT